MNLAPIRKVLVGAVASGIALALNAAGIDLGPHLVNEAAVAVVGFAVAYGTKDPRVVGAVEAAEGFVEELEHKGDAAEQDVVA